MRRQSPRVSPSCTREFGPIDATSRDRLLGPARTTTQPLETEFTQRADARDFDDVAGVFAVVVFDAAAGGDAGVIGATAGGLASIGIGVVGTGVGTGVVSRSTVPALATCTRIDESTLGVATGVATGGAAAAGGATATTVGVVGGVESAFCTVFGRVSE